METSDVSLKNHYYVYVLYCYRDCGLYIGYTSDLRKRLIQHAKGFVPATKLRIPFKLIHYEYIVDDQNARAREVYLKSGYGREQLKNILSHTFINRE